MLGAKSAANRFGGNMADKVADFTGAPTEQKEVYRYLSERS